jgi:hypothetical protein
MTNLNIHETFNTVPLSGFLVFSDPQIQPANDASRVYVSKSSCASLTTASIVKHPVPPDLLSEQLSLSCAKVLLDIQIDLAAYEEGALVVTGLPEMPNSKIFKDPKSGITFNTTTYNTEKTSHIQVGLNWGVYGRTKN